MIHQRRTAGGTDARGGGHERGVDSSVAAALLQEQGHEVIGVTALLCGGASRCCSDEDVSRAREVAAQLGIPHHTLDLGAAFEQVIVAPFIAEYLAGRTPSPCPRCNRLIKFGLLLEQSLSLGADCLATGHYARVTQDDRGWHLRRGLDPRKDQSYFLSLLTQAQLARSVFPLGGMQKAEVVRIARQRNLAARRSKESQELCFVEEGGHGAWIDVRSFDTRGPGDIVDMAGRKVGEHRGIHYYTIGQRRGLGVAAGTPVYVVALDAAQKPRGGGAARSPDAPAPDGRGGVLGGR